MAKEGNDYYEKKKTHNVPTYSRRRTKRKNAEVNDDDDYYEKRKSTQRAHLLENKIKERKHRRK